MEVERRCARGVNTYSFEVLAGLLKVRAISEAENTPIYYYHLIKR